jgi:hypothetical protein
MKKIINYIAVCIIISSITFTGCYVSKEVQYMGYENEIDTNYIVYEFKTEKIDSNLIFTDDIIKIRYTLNHINGGIKFTIENTSNQPLYLDLGKSSVIINKQAFNYRSTLNKDDRFYYIPNQSVLKIDDFNPEIVKLLENYLLTDVGDTNSVFTEETTPFHIRNHLSYSFDEELKKSAVVNNKLWIYKRTKCDNKNEIIFTPKITVRQHYVTVKKKVEKTRYIQEQDNVRTVGLVAGIIAFFVAVVFTIAN